MCFRLSALLQVDADGFDPADGADRRDRAAVVAVLREADSAAVGDRCLAHQGRGTFRVRDDEQEPLPEAERIGGYGGDAAIIRLKTIRLRSICDSRVTD